MALSSEEVGVRKNWLSFSSFHLSFSRSFFVLNGGALRSYWVHFSSISSAPACNSGDFSGTSSNVALALRAGLATLLEGRLHIDLRQEVAMLFKDSDNKIDFNFKLLSPV